MKNVDGTPCDARYRANSSDCGPGAEGWHPVWPGPSSKVRQRVLAGKVILLPLNSESKSTANLLFDTFARMGDRHLGDAHSGCVANAVELIWYGVSWPERDRHCSGDGTSKM